MLSSLFTVFIGGGLGSAARYGIQLLLHERIVAYNFPWATFTVNIIGSFLIGMFYALSDRYNISAELRLLLTAGFCGGFTTFSTFSNDVLKLLQSGEVMIPLIYVLLSIILGIGACFLGASVFKTI